MGRRAEAPQEAVFGEGPAPLERRSIHRDQPKAFGYVCLSKRVQTDWWPEAGWRGRARRPPWCPRRPSWEVGGAAPRHPRLRAHPGFPAPSARQGWDCLLHLSVLGRRPVKPPLQSPLWLWKGTSATLWEELAVAPGPRVPSRVSLCLGLCTRPMSVR